MNKLLFILILAPAIYLLSRIVRGNRLLVILFSLLHAGFLTFMTIFVFSGPGWFWHDQLPFFITESSKREDSSSYKFVRDNFIFLDNSKSKQLIPDPEADFRSSAALPITNRKDLTGAMEMLSANRDKITMVICDVELETNLPEDSALGKFMDTLASEGKLLVASSPADKGNPDLHFTPDVLANVAEQTNDRLYVSHTIFLNGFSLPYKLYYRTRGVQSIEPALFGLAFREKDSSGRRRWVANTFVPNYPLTDEQRLYSEIIPGAGKHQDILTSIESFTTERNVFDLSDVVGFNKPEFITLLNQRQFKKRKNIVFIGTLTSTSDDMKMTRIGQLHGSTILLNLFLAFQQGDHYVSFAFCFFLFISYFLLSLLCFFDFRYIHFFFRRLFPNKPSPVSRPEGANKKTQNQFIRFLMHVGDFFVEEAYLVVIILVGVLTERFTHHAINIIFLGIYFAVAANLAKFFGSKNS